MTKDELFERILYTMEKKGLNLSKRVGDSLIEIIGNIHENPELLEVQHE